MTESPNHPSSGSREEVLAAIRRTFFIPVVRVDRPEHAMCAAEGVVLAGHPLIEMTLTVPNAFAIIEELAKQYGDILYVGAGTVMSVGACQSAIDAGARFIVSPSTDARVIAFAHEHGIACMPGALTPTEVAAAMEAGADLVKIFPAGTAGGPDFIKALKGPFPDVEFVPSGGVSVSNLADYKAARATAVCVGELIFNRKALSEGLVDIIAANTTTFVAAIRSCEFASTR